MDEIFNLLHSPAFWFTSLVSVILAILANRLDKRIPPVSMSWVTALIWVYGVSAIPVTAYAIAAGYPYLFAIPNPTHFESVWTRAIYFGPGFVFAMAMPPCVDVLSIAAPEWTFKTTKLFLGTLIMLLVGAVCYQVVVHRGWTGEVFNIYQVLTLGVALAGVLGTAVIAFTFWVAGIISSFLKRAPLI